ncbi:MAG: hypothetical protein QXL02_01190 [Candidatus Anstonellales archaeon]
MLSIRAEDGYFVISDPKQILIATDTERLIYGNMTGSRTVPDRLELDGKVFIPFQRILLYVKNFEIMFSGNFKIQLRESKPTYTGDLHNKTVGMTGYILETVNNIVREKISNNSYINTIMAIHTREILPYDIVLDYDAKEARVFGDQYRLPAMLPIAKGIVEFYTKLEAYQNSPNDDIRAKLSELVKSKLEAKIRGLDIPRVIKLYEPELLITGYDASVEYGVAYAHRLI